MAVRRLFVEMGDLVENQLARACRALLEGDWPGAQRVIALDADVDALERRVDAACVERFDAHQPTAEEARLVVAAMKAATELERIGDQAAYLAAATPVPPPALRAGGPALRRLCALVTEMVSDAIHALATADAALARHVLWEEEAVEALERDAIAPALAEAAGAPELAHGASRIAYVARALARIAGHATQVAAMAVYVGEGAPPVSPSRARRRDAPMARRRSPSERRPATS